MSHPGRNRKSHPLFSESVHFHGGSSHGQPTPSLTWASATFPMAVWRREGCQVDGVDEAVTLMPRGAEFPQPHFPTQESVPGLSGTPFRRQ
eukprot:1063204-Prymnesium_polylepis.1